MLRLPLPEHRFCLSLFNYPFGVGTVMFEMLLGSLVILAVDIAI